MFRIATVRCKQYYTTCKVIYLTALLSAMSFTKIMSKKIQASHIGLRLGVVVWSVVVVLLGVFVMKQPANAEINMYMTHSLVWFTGKLALVIVMGVYALFSQFRFYALKVGVRVLGLVMVGISIAGLVWGTVFYIRPIDFFIFTEASVLCLLCSMELPMREGKLHASLRLPYTSLKPTRSARTPVAVS